MAYLTYHVAKVAKMARIAGIFSAIVFGLVAAVLATVQLSIPEYSSERIPFGKLALIWGILYLIPGLLLWMFGRMLDSGKLWTLAPILILAAFDLLKVFMFRILFGGICGIVLRIPTMLLVAFVLNAIPDIKDHFRHWRRDRQPRGFQVITAADRKVATPPPAQRLPPRPPRR